ncbi:MAG: sulfotransferase [Spirochaetales bacterium]|nr:sulfotransferase [Spirochaetales bacterium]
MKRVMIETYPRSGHHFLIHKILYPICNNPLNYCECYDHCNTVPCPDNRRIQKSHDFLLKDPILENFKYLIQYRHPYESIVSFFKLMETENNVNYQYDRKGWNDFLNNKIDYWLAFMDKWAGSQSLFNNDVMHVQYSQLINDLEETVTKITHFIEIDDYDKSKLQEINPRKLTNTRNFEYFKLRDIWKVDRRCKEAIKRLQIEKVTI